MCTGKPKSSCDCLRCDIHFIAVIWNQTHSISEAHLSRRRGWRIQKGSECCLQQPLQQTHLPSSFFCGDWAQGSCVTWHSGKCTLQSSALISLVLEGEEDICIQFPLGSHQRNAPNEVRTGDLTHS